MRTVLATYGIAVPLVVVVTVATVDADRIGEAIGRGIAPVLFATAGVLWRRHPVAGFWIAYAFARIAVEVGARG